MNVLSLFDGMSCGQIALQRAGITVNKYYASEIDKYAIKITQKNFPNTIQLWDVKDIKWDDLGIDLLIWGSPCQGFSFAWKQLNFNDHRSALFFEFVRLLKECNPKYFLLENVRMKQEFQDIISEHLWVKPMLINSSLVSAQNRQRYYWTNIPNICQPEDKNILLKDVLNTDWYNWIGTFKNCVRKNIIRDYDEIIKSEKMIYQCDCTSWWQDNKVWILKSPTLRAGNPFVLWLDKNNVIKRLSVYECEKLQTVPHNYTEWVSNSQRYRMLWNGWTVDVISHIFKNMKG